VGLRGLHWKEMFIGKFGEQGDSSKFQFRSRSPFFSERVSTVPKPEFPVDNEGFVAANFV
jgi:hypothetical protein